MRVFAVSDLHVDYEENLGWLRELSSHEYQDDLLILAGDVTNDFRLLKEVLQLLKSRFKELLFVPGNHDLWLHENDFETSLDKFRAIELLCENMQIRNRTFQVPGAVFLPLLGWYDFSFGEPCAYLRRAWRDFKACSWPDQWGETEITNYFLQKNMEQLQLLEQNQRIQREKKSAQIADTIISFSHFLPNLDVMPTTIPKSKRRVYPVLGCDALEEQINRAGSDFHIYGHSHVNQRIERNGTVFVNNAFAYPSETRIARKELAFITDVKMSSQTDSHKLKRAIA